MENKQKMFINAEALLKYLKGEDQLHTLITTQNHMVELVTTDQSIYEALASVEDRKEIDLNLLVKFLEVTKIVSYAESTKETRKILTPERAEELRRKTKNE
ncbi:MAG: hypothetical protein ABIJ34_09350 [archaeon]